MVKESVEECLHRSVKQPPQPVPQPTRNDRCLPTTSLPPCQSVSCLHGVPLKTCALCSSCSRMGRHERRKNGCGATKNEVLLAWDRSRNVHEQSFLSFR